jgi:hypothetical protein
MWAKYPTINAMGGKHVLSLNVSRFGDFVDRIYPIELEINKGHHRYRYVCFIP